MEDNNRRCIVVSEIMTPEKANFAGNIHGGHIMKFCDQVAYACAARYSSSYVVTLSVDKILFKQPIYVGDLVTFCATINYVGHTSMERTVLACCVPFGRRWLVPTASRSRSRITLSTGSRSLMRSRSSPSSTPSAPPFCTGLRRPPCASVS